MKKKALIILAEGFEEIEAVTPIDVLRRAQIEVTVAGLNPEEKLVKGSRDIIIKTEVSLERAGSDFDAVILPGGMPGANNLSKSNRVNSLLSTMNQEGKIIAAICAAPAVVLAPAKILDGKKATSFPGMENLFGKEVVFSDDDVVIDGNIITSKGVGTALRFALAIVEKLAGKEISETIKQKMVAHQL